MTEDAYDQAVADWNELQELRIQLEIARKAFKLIAHPQAPRREIAKEALAQIGAGRKNTADYCTHCKEYVHDDMGHMCPDSTGQKGGE
jgi:recombinational DNA repair protein RecR